VGRRVAVGSGSRQWQLAVAVGREEEVEGEVRECASYSRDLKPQRNARRHKGEFDRVKGKKRFRQDYRIRLCALCDLIVKIYFFALAFAGHFVAAKIFTRRTRPALWPIKTASIGV